MAASERFDALRDFRTVRDGAILQARVGNVGARVARGTHNWRRDVGVGRLLKTREGEEDLRFRR